MPDGFVFVTSRTASGAPGTATLVHSNIELASL